MRRIAVVGVMLAMILAFAAPSWADTVTAGGLIAGELEGGAVVAGSPNLAVGAPTLSFGQDAAAAGNLAPPNALAFGINDPFEVNFAAAGVGPVEDDVVAGSVFVGTNFTEAGFGNLDAGTEDTFLD